MLGRRIFPVGGVLRRDPSPPGEAGASFVGMSSKRNVLSPRERLGVLARCCTSYARLPRCRRKRFSIYAVAWHRIAWHATNVEVLRASRNHAPRLAIAAPLQDHVHNRDSELDVET